MTSSAINSISTARASGETVASPIPNVWLRVHDDSVERRRAMNALFMQSADKKYSEER